MLCNMVCSLFLSEPGESGTERIVTTREKASEARRLAESVITLGKKGTLAHRRRALALLRNNKPAVRKVFSEIAPRYEERPGGYTRILKLSTTRLGDNGSQVIFELVGSERRTAPSRPRGATTPVAEQPPAEGQLEEPAAEARPEEPTEAEAPQSPSEESEESDEEK